MSGGAATVAGRRRIAPRRALARALRAASPRLRRRLLLLVVACLLLAAGYQFWMRDSSFVAVDRVTVTGLTTSDAERVRAALTTAGRTMTTLHVDREALDRAVAGFPVVRELEVSTDFPHGLQVHVVEHHAAALAETDGGRLPVAGDGTILRGLPIEGRLPTVEVDGPTGTERLQDRTALAAAAVAGAAPAVLRRRITEVGPDGDDGLVAHLRDGPDLIFGDATRLAAKWAAAARVLADLEARGASYIDLRIPGRPAAGGLPAETVAPVAPAGATTTVPPAGTGTIPPATDGAGTTTDPSATGQAAAPTAPAATAPTAPSTGTAPTDGTAPPTGTVPPATQPTTPAAPQTPAPTQPTVPATGGAGGGATATP